MADQLVSCQACSIKAMMVLTCLPLAPSLKVRMSLSDARLSWPPNGVAKSRSTA